MNDEKKCFFFYKIGPFPNGMALETKWYAHVHPWQPKTWLYTSTMAGSVGVHLTNECANLDDTWKPLADHRMTLDDAQLRAEKELNAYIETNKPKKYLYCIREYQFESDTDWSPAGISFRDFVGHENSPDLRPITEGFTKQIGKWSITITRNKQYRIPFPLRNELVFNFTDEWEPLGNAELTVEEAKDVADVLLHEKVNKTERKPYYYRIEKTTGGVPRIGKWNTCVKGKRWVKELYGTFVTLYAEEEKGTLSLYNSFTLEEAKIIAEWKLADSFISSATSGIFKLWFELNPRFTIDNGDKLPDGHLDDLYKVIELLHQASGVISEKSNTNS